jgi:uncharacterized repeat protein (TIGR03803 family)
MEILEPRTLLSAASLQTFYSFNGGNASVPAGNVVIDNAGDIFGMESGGAYGQGALWELEAGGTTFDVLGSFDGTHWMTLPGQVLPDSATTAGSPIQSVIYQAGSSEATLSLGGPLSGQVTDSVGNVFWVDGTDSVDKRQPFGSFSNFSNTPLSLTGITVVTLDPSVGSDIVGSLTVDNHNNVYGVVASGGANGYGGIFEIPAGQTTAELVASFDGTNGQAPLAGLTTDNFGNLYGTTSLGGSSHEGNVFEVAAGSGTITNLASFVGTNGQDPSSSLVIDSTGDLLGTTPSGGAQGTGTVFEISAGTHQLSTLVNFGASQGLAPNGGLTLDAAGNLYGTTSATTNSAVLSLFKISFQQYPELTFEQSASTITVGQSSSTVNVDIDLSANQIDTTSSANVTFTVLSADGATLQTQTVSTQQGVAAFDGHALPVGTYTLVATSDSLNTASTSLSVVPGVPTQLVFLSEPTSAIQGQSLGTIQVAVEDAEGDIVTQDQSVVTISCPGIPLSTGLTLNGNGSLNILTGECQRPLNGSDLEWKRQSVRNRDNRKRYRHLYGVFNQCHRYFHSDCQRWLEPLRQLRPGDDHVKDASGIYHAAF